MLFFISLIPATALAVVGYFVLFSTNWAEGTLRSFGWYLGIWILALAAVLVLGGLLASIVGWSPRDSMMGDFAQHMDRMLEVEEEQLTVLQELQQN